MTFAFSKRFSTSGHPGDRSLHPERVLLFCVASDTEWERAGILIVIGPRVGELDAALILDRRNRAAG
jgi:hypothetical protein